MALTRELSSAGSHTVKEIHVSTYIFIYKFIYI